MTKHIRVIGTPAPKLQDFFFQFLKNKIKFNLIFFFFFQFDPSKLQKVAPPLTHITMVRELLVHVWSNLELSMFIPINHKRKVMIQSD